MPSGLFLGLLVLCSSLLLLLAEQCPPSFTCEGLIAGGDIGIKFPLTNTTNPECGLLVRGCGERGAAVEIRLGNENQRWIELQYIEQTVTLVTSLSVKDRQLDDILSSETGSCNLPDYDFTLPPASPIMSLKNIFNYNFTVFKCNKTLDVSPPKTFVFEETVCDAFDLNWYSYDVFVGNLSGRPVPTSFNACTISHIPAAYSSANGSKLEKSAEYNIEVTLSEECRQCFGRGGQCRLDSKGKFRCVAEDRGSDDLAKVFIVATAASAALVGMLVVLNCCLRRKVTSASIFFWKGKNPTHQTIEEFLKRHETSILTKRYTYSEIREMTSSFKNRLGQGGYGRVYKGRLPDGCLVAVKILGELKGNGEEFINEVASISQTSHVNVVSLFGFCFQGSKRALVYEFMPNGSLDKFIYEDNATMVDRQLDCKTLYDIAIGIARGLEYLHKGCNTRILHLDIKPHNILLDVDFCPKISDFGLSKICSRKESIVSMLDARGTLGYIAPEVFSRNFGGVFHKSDVYSFGMMVLEMVGGRKNISVEVESSSKIYFPYWIYKCLESNQELALRCIKNENDNEMMRKMIVVSLWCIQTDPSTRPAMRKVVDMLEGSLELLQIPPKPFLSSPKNISSP